MGAKSGGESAHHKGTMPPGAADRCAICHECVAIPQLFLAIKIGMVSIFGHDIVMLSVF
jgi:hypothetical protein